LAVTRDSQDTCVGASLRFAQHSHKDKDAALVAKFIATPTFSVTG
jgi:hypothetical protein